MTDDTRWHDHLYSILPSPPDPALRVPITPRAIAPLFVLYYLQAVLAILPGTFFFKLLVLPLVCWRAWHAAVDLDFAKGVAGLLNVQNPDRVVDWNYAYVIGAIFIALRAFSWTFVKKPLRRYETPRDGEPLAERPLTLLNVLVDAGELLFSSRGYGWNWTRRPFPRVHGRPPTLFQHFRMLIFKITAFDGLHFLLQYYVPSLDRVGGDTIFDSALPPVQRYCRSTLITLATGFIVYVAVDIVHLAAGLVGCVLLDHTPAQWPPISDKPWRATSLADFWGRRWHQFFRHLFITTGARPLRALFGEPGAVLGAFGVSAVLHDVGMWGLGRGTEFRTVGGFFVMSGVGVLLEAAWRRVTGRRVGGMLGWAWTMAWTLGWWNMMVDAWARRGLVGSDFIPPAWRPGKTSILAVMTRTIP